jgi:N-methylhydantoinase A
MSDRYRVAVDIGGTFTDAVAMNEDTGEFLTGKAPTTPDDLVRGVMDAVGTVVGDPSRITSFVHGTTVGLNALLQRSGERVALLATSGAGDSYHIARGHRLDIFNIHHTKAAPLVRRRDVLEIGGRLDWQGNELVPLSAADLETAADYLRAQGIRSVAIAFLFSYVNPAHELAAAQYLLAAVDGLTVSVSHEVAREWREYERTSTAVLNAYSGPTVREYLAKLEAGLTAAGVRAPLRVMQSNGGIIGAQRARKQPLQTFFSGPVGGAAGGAVLARTLDRKNLICIDMGGTSFDMSLIIDGRPEILPQAEIERFPVLMSVVDIETIGAGGGSVAFLEAGGLRVGPRSAGAVPGPVCYGRGGRTPTVTDANLVLGRIDPDRFLGGRMRLDRQLALDSFGEIADQLSLEPLVLAEGVVDVINAKMSQAIRAITVERGIEPRGFTLVAFGGAGALHACALADDLSIGEVVVPDMPGAFSAWGMLQSPLRQDFAAPLFSRVDELDSGRLRARFAELEVEASELLAAEGVDLPTVEFRWAVDLRYVGQEHTFTLPVPAAVADPLAVASRDFHEAYRRRYGHASPEAPLETVNLRLTALSETGLPDPREIEPQEVPADRAFPVSEAVFGRRAHPTPRATRGDLRVGEVLFGPVIIDEPTSTTIVPPNWIVTVDGFRSLVLTRRDKAVA